MDWTAPEWHDLAACKGKGDLFYPTQGEGGRDVPIAKKICAGCPVRAECLDAGMSELYGVWGGTDNMQRRKLRKKAGRSARPARYHIHNRDRIAT